MFTSTHKINISPEGVPLVLHVTQNDVGLREFIFEPYTTDGMAAKVSGASATIEATKPDHTAVVHNCTYNNDGSITYVLQDQLAAVKGRVWSKLTIRDTNGGVVGFAAIVWMVDMAGVADDAIMSDSDISALQEFVNEFGTINAYKAALDGALAAVGGPYVANTVSQMTDHAKVYVYTGSQTGYTAGHWYYWNGSAWTDGGVYQAAAVETDKTLTVADMAADAKATGDAVTELKNEIRPVTNTWESGNISSSTGADATSNKNLRTSNYLGTEINGITAKTGYLFRLAAYEADDTYVGMWNSASAKFMRANVTLTSIDLKMIRNMFPTYKYRLDMKLSSDAAISLSESSNLVYDPSSDVGINSENIEKETQRAKTAESGLLKGGYVFHEIQGGLVVGTIVNGEPYHVSNTDMCTDRKQEFTEDCIITTDWSKYSVLIIYFVQGEYDSYVVAKKDTALSANDVIRLVVRKKSGNLTDEDKADIVANTFYKTRSFLSNTIETVGDYAEVREAVIKADDFLVPIVFEVGTLNGSSGKEVDASGKVRTAGFLSEPGTYLLRPDGQNIFTYKYTSDGTFVNGVAPWGKKVDYLLTIEEGYKYRFVSTDTDDVTPANNKFKIYRRTAIKDIHDGIVYDNAYLSLPSYFVGNVQNGVARYKSIKNNIIGDSFCFLTDVHLNANRMHSGSILRYIGKNTDCKKVFCGGDISMAYNSDASVDFLKEYVESWLAEMRKSNDSLEYYGMRGNHDMYVYTSNAMTTKYELPYSGAYAVTCGANGPVSKTGDPGTMYYAVDNLKEKIRYICCDTSDTSDTQEDCQDRMQLTQDQLQWIADAMLEVDTGWSIVVMGHVPCSEDLYGFPQGGYQRSAEDLAALGDILKDYKNKRSTNTYGDFSAAKGELVAYICGHAHTDFSAVDDGVLFIQVTCDCKSQIEREGSDYNWTRTNNTVSEQCIDIFTIDTLNKKLYATRFGVGGYGDAENGIEDAEDIFDRVWDY